MAIVLAGAKGQPALEGCFEAGATAAALVAPPHPLYGGRLDNPVVAAIARGLGEAGLARLRFNFRGTGESEGAASGEASDADADVRAAFERLTVLQPGPYLGAGYSFGAAAALRVAAREPRMHGLLLVAPPLGMLDLQALRALRCPVRWAVGDEDEYCDVAELGAALGGMTHVELHVIAGADHFFSMVGFSRLQALARAAGNALLTNRPA